MDYRQLLSIMLDDTTQEDLAEELDTTQATISRWLKGQEPRGAALERIRKLARARRLASDATIEQDFVPSDSRAGITSDLSEFSTDHIALSDKEARRKRAAAALEQGAASGKTAQGARANARGDNGREASLPRGDIANFTIHAGMGNGGTMSVQVDEDGKAIDPSDSDGFWSFPDGVKAGWRQMGQTYAMPVTGDSMEPTLQNGAYVFVDTSHTYPSPPDLYAVNYGHGLMIKRLELLPDDKIRVISDNDRYTDFEFSTQDVEVYGRVVASFQFR